MALREMAFKYSAKGAKAVQRADSKVQSQINKTAKDARKNTGTINRWMERNKAAMAGIAGAAVGAMGAIISASPTARAELAGVRTAFSLFADTVINDVLPAGSGLMDWAFRAERAYANLPDPIRETLSTFSILAGVLGAVVLVGSVLAGVVGGPLIAGVLALAAAVAIGVKAWSLIWTFVKPHVLDAVDDMLQALGWLRDFLGADSWGQRLEMLRQLWADFRDMVVKWLGKAKDRAIELAKELVDGVVDWIKDLPGRAATWVGEVYDEIKDRLAGLRDDALGWGKDMVNNFIDGIKSRLSNLRGVAGELREAIPFIGVIEDMVKQITKPLKKLTQEIRDYLPSSPAKKGPLSDLNKVERAIPNALNGGLEGGVNNVQQNLTGRVGRSVSGGGGQSVSIGEINVEVMGGGTGRRTGKDIAQEVSKEINNQFESRR